MHVFNLEREQAWDPKKHVEQVLGKVEDGDVTVACWEPGQISPNHCHPEATEIYFCFSGGGVMRTPTQTVEVVPGSFVVHPPGELHEYENGRERTLLFRVRYGKTCAPTSPTGAAMRAGPSRPRTRPISRPIRSGKGRRQGPLTMPGIPIANRGLPTISPAFEILPDLYSPHGGFPKTTPNPDMRPAGMVLRAIDALSVF